MTALVRYDAMCRAIAEAYAVDEVKDIRDKALAIEALNAQEHCPSFFFPESPGVYVFDDLVDDVTLYVGESRHLRRRLTRHSRGYLRRAIGVRCRVLPCANHKRVERWLIAALNPILNGVSEIERRRRLRLPHKTQDQIDKEFAQMWDALFGENSSRAALLRHADALEACGQSKFGSAA